MKKILYNSSEIEFNARMVIFFLALFIFLASLHVGLIVLFGLIAPILYGITSLCLLLKTNLRKSNLHLRDLKNVIWRKTRFENYLSSIMSLCYNSNDRYWYRTKRYKDFFFSSYRKLEKSFPLVRVVYVYDNFTRQIKSMHVDHVERYGNQFKQDRNMHYKLIIPKNQHASPYFRLMNGAFREYDNTRLSINDFRHLAQIYTNGRVIDESWPAINTIFSIILPLREMPRYFIRNPMHKNQCKPYTKAIMQLHRRMLADVQQGQINYVLVLS